MEKISREQALELLGKEIHFVSTRKAWEGGRDSESIGYLAGLRYAQSLMRQIDPSLEGKS